MLLLIDNYDSFSQCIARYFRELGQKVMLVKNDAITLNEITRLNPNYIVLSPGPCSPNEAGITLEVVRNLQGSIPILGICLGHQAIAQALGGNIVHAPLIMHGKTSLIMHNKQGIFKNIPSPFTATRYHSLVVDEKHLPNCLDITAYTQDYFTTEHGTTKTVNSIMGLKHTHLPIEGIQFHPESVLSEHGHALLNEFLNRYQ